MAARTGSRRAWGAVAGALVVLHLALLAILARQTPWTADEPVLLIAGKAMVEGRGWRTPVERFHGPLPLLANQALLGSADRAAIRPDHTGPFRFRARLGMLPFALLLLLVVWRWSHEAWGPAGARLSLLLAALSPNFLGYGPLLAVDVAHAAMAALTLWLLWRWLRAPSWWGPLLWGGALGLLLATKYLALALAAALPLALLAALLGGRRFPRPGPWPRRAGAALGALLLAAAAALVALHGAYLFRAPLYDPARTPLGSGFLGALGRLPAAGELLRLLPEPLVLGADFQAAASQGYAGLFLDRVGPHWAYYLTALAVKTPLPTLLLALLSLFAPRGRGGSPRHLGAVLLPPLALLALLSLANRLQIGIRYILPLYPLLWVQAGAWASRPWAAAPAGRAVTALLALWLAAGTALAWPHLLGFFNEAAGGPAGGWRLFADSNCDWDQDRLAGVAELRNRHPALKVLGPGDGPRFGTLAAYALHLKPPDPERPGRTYHWLARFRPMDHYGAAWLVFRVGPEEFAAAARRGDGRAARELVLAWVGEGRLDRAREALAGVRERGRAESLERLLARLERLDQGRGNEPDRSEAVDLLAAQGRPDMALEVLRQAPAPERTRLFALLFASGRAQEAVGLLTARAKAAPLTAEEALLLAGGRFWTGDLAGAKEALESQEPPPAKDPLRPLWEAFRKQILELLEAARKLEIRR